MFWLVTYSMVLNSVPDLHSKLCINQYISIVNPLWTDIQAQPQTKTCHLHLHDYESHAKAFGNYCLVSKTVVKKLFIICTYTSYKKWQYRSHTPGTNIWCWELWDISSHNYWFTQPPQDQELLYTAIFWKLLGKKNINTQFTLVWCYIWSMTIGCILLYTV